MFEKKLRAFRASGGGISDPDWDALSREAGVITAEARRRGDVERWGYRRRRVDRLPFWIWVAGVALAVCCGAMVAGL